MAEARVQGEIPAAIDDVWKVVSDFAGFLTIAGVDVATEGEGIGMRRTINLGGAEVVERLESIDDANYSTSYSILSAPLPLTDYVATIKLSPASDTTTAVDWTSTFEPVGDEGPAKAIVEQIYNGGIQALQKHFAG
jgi:Polyketide cyclase / dehydrase and lipid transport